MTTSLAEKLGSRAVASFLAGAYYARESFPQDARHDVAAAESHGQAIEHLFLSVPERDIVETVRRYAGEIKNGRTLQDILNHLLGEANEAQDEIDKIAADEPEGEDGIIGEAIDMVQCGLDIIFTARPNITKAELETIMETKCQKWARWYSNSISKATEPF